jgi:hypothetical protein
MRRILLSAALGALATAWAGAASATIIISGDVEFGDKNPGGGLATVHLPGADDGSDELLIGTVNGGALGDLNVLITGNEDISPSSDGNGQPWVIATNGTGLNFLDISIQNGFTFEVATFNLTPLSQGGVDWNVTIFGVTSGGVTESASFEVKNNNFFYAQGLGGTRLTHMRFETNGELIQGVGQIRLDGIAAVPEPATWAMMITGFGAAGAMLRRRRALALA